MFYGEYEASLDAKNRVAFPAPFRNRLEPAERERLVLTPMPDGCIALYTLAEWQRLEREVAEASGTVLGTAQARDFERALYSRAADVDIDKQGRILLPERLRKEGGLRKDVVFVGVRNRVEIWDRARWEAGEPKRARTFRKVAERTQTRAGADRGALG